MKAIWRGFKALLLVALGAALAVGLGQCGKKTFPSHWFTIDEDTNSNISWSAQLIEKAEKFGAAIPQVSSATGRAKFVTSGQRDGQYTAPLGYEVEILLDSQEQMARANEAAKQKGLKSDWEVKVYPDNVKVGLDFVLRDKDGFQLATLKGQHDSYESFGSARPGAKTMLKGTSVDKVSVADALATHTIECAISCEDMSVNSVDYIREKNLGVDLTP
jgi:hypothetical protein